MSDADSIDQIIQHGAITTFLQPIVHTRKHNVWGYEALSRGPLLSRLRRPENLAKCAVAAGLHLEFECSCIDIALRNFSTLPLDGRLFVNVSYETLDRYDIFEPAIIASLSEYQIDPQRVVLELTEHSPIRHINRLKTAVENLRRIGFSIALDDLGAGYSSLRLWSQLDPDYVKFDRHFIYNIENDAVKQRFVHSLVNLARNQGCRVIAEGVQTRGEAQWLAETQIRLMQGYYFSRPRIRPTRINATRFPSYYVNHSAETDAVSRMAR